MAANQVEPQSLVKVVDVEACLAPRACIRVQRVMTGGMHKHRNEQGSFPTHQVSSYDNLDAPTENAVQQQMASLDTAAAPIMDDLRDTYPIGNHLSFPTKRIVTSPDHQDQHTIAAQSGSSTETVSGTPCCRCDAPAAGQKVAPPRPLVVLGGRNPWDGRARGPESTATTKEVGHPRPEKGRAVNVSATMLLLQGRLRCLDSGNWWRGNHRRRRRCRGVGVDPLKGGHWSFTSVQ
ncbi:hypothetical protein B0H14DRAFT_2620842 [Mycena olivaceomarginata]|nr:hypothetical protein B0H14DRAFT_2620842 [Mycena olivaceomarginata]